jgi:signal transduction histidine kinase/ligand-binding sensor domain-containing protein
VVALLFRALRAAPWRAAAACLAAGATLAARAHASGDSSPSEQRVTTWTIADGLPQGTINALAQTPDGALWIATFGGLVRFDGIEFRTYDLDALAGLATNRLTGLAVDPEGGLWVLTQAGELVHLRGDEVTEVVRADPEGGVDALAVMVDNADVVWVRQSSGALSRRENGTWTTPVGRIGGSSYRGMCASADGTVWTSNGDLLTATDAAGSVLHRLTAPTAVLAVENERGDGPWLGTNQGLARVRAGSIESIAIEPPIDPHIRCILSDDGDGLWIGTEDGAAHVRPRGAGEPWIADCIPALPARFQVRSMLRDREGNLWLGSPEIGLARITPFRVVHRAGERGINPVCALVDDGEGGAWIGSEHDGLLRRTRDAVLVPVALCDAPARKMPIDALLRDRQGRVWAARADQVFRSSAFTFVPVARLPHAETRVAAMVEDGAGRVWIGTNESELLELGPDDALVRTWPVPATIGSLSVAPDGSIWIGSKGEVLHFSAGRFERIGSSSGVPGDDVRDVVTQSDGAVWLASYGGGLGFLRDGRVTMLARQHGLPDTSLSRILDDGRGNFWMLSNRGLIIARKDELADVVAGRAHRFDPVVLGPETGMPEGKFGSPSGFVDGSGVLWFGTIDGAVRVDPREFPFNRTPPIVRIEGVLAEDSALPFESDVEIPAGTRRIVIGFTAFALTAPERVHFRYRMQGLDEHWIDVGSQRSAVFTALAPGSYVFEAAARNEDGVWSESPAFLRVEKLPSWWETRWFEGAALVAAAGLVLALHQRRVRRLSRESAVLLAAAEERRAAEENASRLREELAHVARVATAGELATSLAHEVNQPLAAIVANAQAGRRFLSGGGATRAELDEILVDIAQQGVRASEVIKRLRGFLRKRPGEQRALDVDEEVRAALPLVRRELQDHQVEVRLELETGSARVLGDPVQLQQVLINLLKNACEAMSSSSGPRVVTLRTRTAAGKVAIEVRDTGPGLPPEIADRLFQPFVTTKAKGMGLGLTICRSIAESHGGTLGAEVAAEGGMLFRIVFPTMERAVPAAEVSS